MDVFCFPLFRLFGQHALDLHDLSGYTYWVSSLTPVAPFTNMV